MALRAPPQRIVAALRPQLTAFVQRVQASRVPTSVGITSWYRSLAENARVGGAAQSQHLLGLAIDTTPSGASARRATVSAFRAAGLVAIEEGDHVHAQLFAAGVLPADLFRRLAS